MKQVKEIKIRTRTLMLIFAILPVVIVVIALMRGNVGEESAPVPTTAAVGERRILEASSDGIDVIVEDIQRAGGKTLVTLAMSNHQYDLSDPSIGERSSLAGINPIKFDVIENNIGGHHVTAEMWFDGELYGQLVVSPTEETVLNFGI